MKRIALLVTSPYHFNHPGTKVQSSAQGFSTVVMFAGIRQFPAVCSELSTAHRDAVTTSAS